MSIDRRMDEEAVIRIHNKMLLSHKKECISVLMSWRNLESVIESEVNHRDKNKYHILMQIYRI